MIRRAERADAPAVLAAVARTPGLGPRAWAKWCIQGENPRYPGDFYLYEQKDGSPGLLFLDGAEGMLCTENVGGPETADSREAEELLAFLDFMRVQKLRTIGWLPPGLRDTNDTPLLVAKGPLRAAVAGQGDVCGLSLSNAPAIVEFPPAAEVCAVLAGAGLLPDDAQARENFASDYNTRRNHDVSLVAGIELDGRLVATAGAYAIAPGEAYLSSVATLPGYRGQGFAAALLAHLQGALAGRMLSLFSLPQSVDFYTRLGFEPWPVKRMDVQF